MFSNPSTNVSTALMLWLAGAAIDWDEKVCAAIDGCGAGGNGVIDG